MQLHNLIKTTKTKPQKRVGRGGKRGTTSGKGQKGQKSRSGHRIRPAVRDLIIRIPKLRGFKNKPLLEKVLAVDLNKIAAKIQDSVITFESLVKAGLIKKNQKRVKILGGGEIKRPLTVKGLKASKSVKAKIEAAGGSISES